MSLIWEIPRVLWHLAKGFINYARGRGFTDEG